MRELCFSIGVFVAIVFCVSCVSFTKQELAAEYHGIAEDFFALGEYEAAQKYFLRALDISQYPNKSLFNLARVYIEMEQFQSAKEIILELGIQDPDNLTVNELHAYVLFRQGHYEEARLLYEEMLDRSQDLRILKNLLKLYFEMNEAISGIADLTSIVDEGRDDIELLGLYVHGLLKEEEVEMAQPYVEDYLEGIHTDASSLLSIAQALENAAMLPEAVDAYTSFINIETSRTDIMLDLARIRIMEGLDVLKGMDLLRQVLSSGYKDEELLSSLLTTENEAGVQGLLELYEEFDIDISGRDS